MHQQKSKKILIYFFLFFIIGTLNNKNFNEFHFPKLKKIEINGLEENDNFDLLKKLNYIGIDNLFFINETELIEIINSNKLVERYSVFKKYPSSLKIDIIKTEFLANVKIGSEIFFLGSNGKLIKSNNADKNLPFIFGKFDIKNYLSLISILSNQNINLDKITKYYYHKNKRWDLYFDNNILIKLPDSNIEEAIILYNNFKSIEGIKSNSIVDLRIQKRITIKND